MDDKQLSKFLQVITERNVPKNIVFSDMSQKINRLCRTAPSQIKAPASNVKENLNMNNPVSRSAFTRILALALAVVILATAITLAVYFAVQNNPPVTESPGGYTPNYPGTYPPEPPITPPNDNGPPIITPVPQPLNAPIIKFSGFTGYFGNSHDLYNHIATQPAQVDIVWHRIEGAVSYNIIVNGQTVKNVPFNLIPLSIPVYEIQSYFTPSANIIKVTAVADPQSYQIYGVMRADSKPSNIIIFNHDYFLAGQQISAMQALVGDWLLDGAVVNFGEPTPDLNNDHFSGLLMIDNVLSGEWRWRKLNFVFDYQHYYRRIYARVWFQEQDAFYIIGFSADRNTITLTPIVGTGPYNGSPIQGGTQRILTRVV